MNALLGGPTSSYRPQVASKRQRTSTAKKYSPKDFRRKQARFIAKLKATKPLPEFADSHAEWVADLEQQQRLELANEHLWEAFNNSIQIAAPNEDVARAAVRVMRVLAFALHSNDTRELLWLSKRLEPRRRRHWLEWVKREVENIRGLRHGELKQLAEAEEKNAISNLGHALAFYDPRARSLTPEQTAKALKVPTVEGIAARLAVDCGAFGYGPRDFASAKAAFRNLDKDE